MNSSATADVDVKAIRSLGWKFWLIMFNSSPLDPLCNQRALVILHKSRPGSCTSGARAYSTNTVISKSQEAAMARKYIDCREFPSESKCTVAISAASEKELIEVAVQHAVKVHGHQDTAEFRQMLKQAIKEGSPPP